MERLRATFDYERDGLVQNCNEAADRIEGTKLVMDSQQNAIEGQDKIITELEQRIERDAQDKVPREPTEAMIEAGEEHYRVAPCTESRRGMPDPDVIWRAMYDAARGKGE